VGEERGDAGPHAVIKDVMTIAVIKVSYDLFPGDSEKICDLEYDL
jgi:hypothetical protein